MVRVPEAKRVRSVIAYLTLPAPTGTPSDAAHALVFQDDVKIIGVELCGRWSIDDTLSNTDGSIVSLIELTRAATRQQPAMIARLDQHATWNGILCIGGDLTKEVIVMFGNDAGIEVDEGEYINLLAHVEYVGAGSAPFDATAIIYYVER